MIAISDNSFALVCTAALVLPVTLRVVATLWRERDKATRRRQRELASMIVDRQIPADRPEQSAEAFIRAMGPNMGLTTQEWVKEEARRLELARRAAEDAAGDGPEVYAIGQDPEEGTPTVVIDPSLLPKRPPSAT